MLEFPQNAQKSQVPIKSHPFHSLFSLFLTKDIWNKQEIKKASMCFRLTPSLKHRHQRQDDSCFLNNSLMFEEITQEMERLIKRWTQDEEEWIHASLTALIKSIEPQKLLCEGTWNQARNKEVKFYPETGILAASGRTCLLDLNTENNSALK